MRDALIWLGVVVAVLIVLAGVWLASVALAPVLGKGQQQIQLNSAENRTFQYQHFFTLDADIRAQASNAQAAKRSLEQFEVANPPPRSYALDQLYSSKQATAEGLQQLCISNVEEYNAQAAQWTTSQFQSNNLPFNHSTTECSGGPSAPAPQPHGE